MTQNDSYDPRFFGPLFAAEERHFWFVSRNSVIKELVKKAVISEKASILEIGCGTGNVLQNLEKDFPSHLLVGVDIYLEGLSLARKRVQCPLVQADLASPPFKFPFDLVGMFDVLEHIREDQSVLNQMQNVISPGGKLLITVPAEPRLWSYFDVASHHERRYTLEDLISKVQNAGFEVVFSSPFFAVTYPILWMNRGIKSLIGKNMEFSANQYAENDLKIIPGLNGLLRMILGMEATWLAKGNTLPFGSSLILLARKPLISG